MEASPIDNPATIMEATENKRSMVTSSYIGWEIVDNTTIPSIECSLMVKLWNDFFRTTKNQKDFLMVPK
jgi:hypothetical protein